MPRANVGRLCIFLFFFLFQGRSGQEASLRTKKHTTYLPATFPPCEKIALPHSLATVATMFCLSQPVPRFRCFNALSHLLLFVRS
jgi:hypothetical protein